jgi:TRAP-type C4-dicarboxylate transport system permease small subunit
MAEQEFDIDRPRDAFGRMLFGLSWTLALIGGILCSAIAVLVCVSVTGRYLFSSPVPGDYDIIGILSGCAVFAFLPYCQMVRGNIVVDFFTTGASQRTKLLLDAMGTMLILIVAVIFTWRLYHGMLDLKQQNEVISAFMFYRWWTVPFDLFCMVVLIAVIIHSLMRDLTELTRGDTVTRQS